MVLGIHHVLHVHPGHCVRHSEQCAKVSGAASDLGLQVVLCGMAMFAVHMCHCMINRRPFEISVLYTCDMFPYTDKEMQWLNTGKAPKKQNRKSNKNRHRQAESPEQTEWKKVGHYWFIPFNRFII